MVWRRSLVAAVLIAAACGDHAYDVGIDEAAEAGAAGEPAQTPSANGGGPVTRGGPVTGSAGTPVGSAAGSASTSGGTSGYDGAGAADTSQPIAGQGGASGAVGTSGTVGTSGAVGTSGTGSADVAGNGPALGTGGAGGESDDDTGGAPDAPGGAAASSGPDGQYTGNGRAADCILQSMSTQADVTPTDQCTALYWCSGNAELEVTCDGENDGTSTSLCDCRSGELRWSAPSLIQGEAPVSCENGMAACFGAWPSGG